MNPETLQTLGVLAIGLGFVLIGLGGFSTYHASQKIQHIVELREAEQKGEMNSQLVTLLLKNQELQNREMELQKAQQPQAPPPAAYYRPPAPPPPTFSTPPAPPASGAEAPAAGAPPPVAEQEVPMGPAPDQPIAQPLPGHAMEPPRASDWEAPESLDPELQTRYLSIRQQHVIADTLRAHGRHVVMLESSYGDPVSREFAQELGMAFAEADWIVRGVAEHRGLPLASGITVSAGSFPPRPETRAMYEALLSAGIAVTQQLDPRQRESETIVFVGSPL